jgi:hypothetical protein
MFRWLVFIDPLYNSQHFIHNLAEINSTVLFLHRFRNNTTLFRILNLSKNFEKKFIGNMKKLYILITYLCDILIQVLNFVSTVEFVYNEVQGTLDLSSL